jgi:flagellar hook-basal body complex protein FliE
MSPIGLIDVSSLLRSPEKMPTVSDATGGAGATNGLGFDPSIITQAMNGATGVTPTSDTSSISGASASMGALSGGRPVNFSNVLENAVNEVNAKMQAADAAKTQVLTGETTNVHQAMIAVQESSVAFGLMVEVRNKLVESYQELMRMSV